ncbi:hypothetical protein ACRB68_56280 [Actinomadura sp. RB68]|uniref:HD domain-containing protein n=1 Tax=Actinomadura macrotermitis TaxID=2585200 RepID=A0A7K0C246_9ACTN|nr:hypothetical protein [Actinomadura macrotermitis]
MHLKYAPTPDAFDIVHTHCEIVWKVAEQLLEQGALSLDAELVRAGCLLHDIGVYRLYDSAGGLDHASYIRHGVLGYEVLQAEGFPEILCRFCSCHTGVGITREDVREQGLPLPVADYVAESGEEELVMYADKFHSKTDPPTFVSADTYAGNVRRFGEAKEAAFRGMCEVFGLPDLAPLADKYGYAVV